MGDGIGIDFSNLSADGFNNDTPYPLRYRTSALGGSDPQFIVPAAPNFPNPRAQSPDRYIYEFPGMIDLVNIASAIFKDGATELTRVTATPTANEYRVVINANSEKRGQIEFDSAQGGKPIDYDVHLLGGNITGDEFNNMNIKSLTVRDQGLIILEDRKVGNGGTFTSGAWQTRDLTTEVADTNNHCTLAANQFTLAAGTYYIRSSAPALNVNQHNTRLQNITDASTTLEGSSEISSNASTNNCTRSLINGTFTIATPKTFEIQHRCAFTVASLGFGTGIAVSFGATNDIYTTVTLEKLS